MRVGRKIADDLEERFGVVEEGSFKRRVVRIGEKVARVSDRQDIPYRFNVLDTGDINAISCPGGYVYATKGLMLLADDDELACVLGHELGHLASYDQVKSMQAQLGYSIFANLILRGESEGLQDLSDAFFNLIMLGYSREAEYRADWLGALYAYRAGYNPWGMVSFLKKLQRLEKAEGRLRIPFLSTHPLTEDRIEKISYRIEYLLGAEVEKNGSNREHKENASAR